MYGNLLNMPNLMRVGLGSSDLLESFNALFIDFRDPSDGKPLNLRDGSKINITMPVRDKAPIDDQTYFWEYRDSSWK